MGFTIEDMLLVSRDRYQMTLIAGEAGWSNSISWLLMLEDITIIHNFSGKELAVTTGLGFKTEESLLELVRQLLAHNASGLIINTGFHIHDIPESVIHLCEENDFPLLTVPWDVILADMIKDLSIRVFLQSTADEQISAAFIRAIEEPNARALYEKDLLPHFDVDGTFQLVLVTTKDLDKMDTVERKRIAYRMQLYLSNLTHNGHFFYYASCFVIIINAVSVSVTRDIINGFYRRLLNKMASFPIYIGVSDPVTDISRLRIAYHRANAALRMAEDQQTGIQYFSEMGIYRLLYSVPDTDLLHQLSSVPLAPLAAYDKQHDANYVRTLELFLKYDGSIQAVAEELYIHRNTVQYRMNNIKQLLNSSLDSEQERLPYHIACLIQHMNL